jgi:hypothetical protein
VVAGSSVLYVVAGSVYMNSSMASSMSSRRFCCSDCDVSEVDLRSKGCFGSKGKVKEMGRSSGVYEILGACCSGALQSCGGAGVVGLSGSREIMRSEFMRSRCWSDELPGYKDTDRSRRCENPPSYVVAGSRKEPASGAEDETSFSSRTNVKDVGRSFWLKGLSLGSLSVEEEEKPGDSTGSL